MIAGVGAIGAILWIIAFVVGGLIILAFYKPWDALLWAVLIVLLVTAPIFGPFARYKMTSWRAGFDFQERNIIRGNETNFGVRTPDDGSILDVRPSMPKTIQQKLSFSIAGPDENFPIDFSVIATNKTDLAISLDGCALEPERDGLLLLSGEDCGAADSYNHVFITPQDAPVQALLYQSRYDEFDRLKNLRVYHDGFLIAISSRILPRADWETYVGDVLSTLDANFVILPD